VIAIGVDDLEQAVAGLRAKGADFIDEIFERPWGRIIPFAEPDGNELQLYGSPRDSVSHQGHAARHGQWAAPDARRRYPSPDPAYAST